MNGYERTVYKIFSFYMNLLQNFSINRGTSIEYVPDILIMVICYNKFAQRKISNCFYTNVHINSWLLMMGKPRNLFRQILRCKNMYICVTAIETFSDSINDTFYQ